METTITVTTINKPVFLDGLCENIARFGHKNTDIIIIGDVKTPPIEDYCKEVSAQYGVPIEYLDIPAQEKILPKPLLKMFDYNTPDRTILGGMLAYMRGAERIIAIDDDNFVTGSDFIGGHEIVNKYIVDKQTGKRSPLPISIKVLTSDTGWVNVYETVDAVGGATFYPRGFPFGQRHKLNHISQVGKQAIVAVNQGLVLGDPDIDALQRLVYPINALQSNHTYPPQFGLYNSWSPFNYQNTCIARDLIPCYFRPKSGLRNADIWTAYIFNRLVEHMGGIVTFGEPLVNQVRNEHDLFADLDIELQNNKESDYFCRVLKEAVLTKTIYIEALNELLSKVEVDDNHPMTKSFFKEYRKWCEVVAEYV